MVHADGFPAMVSVFRLAADIARKPNPEPTLFDGWYAFYERQSEWAKDTDNPLLLWSCGVSLVKQAVLDV